MSQDNAVHRRTSSRSQSSFNPLEAGLGFTLPEPPRTPDLVIGADGRAAEFQHRYPDAPSAGNGQGSQSIAASSAHFAASVAAAASNTGAGAQRTSLDSRIDISNGTTDVEDDAYYHYRDSSDSSDAAKREKRAAVAASNYKEYPPYPASRHSLSGDAGGEEGLQDPLLASMSPSLDDLAAARRSGRSFCGIPALFGSRGRVHPLVMIPAFFLGIAIAMSGMLGPTHAFTAASANSGSHDSCVLPDEVVASIGPATKHSTYLSQNRPATALYSYHESGHMYLNPAALDSSPLQQGVTNVEHPIFQLIREGNRKWENKLKRQSKTLADAVKEYKRRYGRNPPKGFDKWYAFATENNVVLIDEFDNIHRDLKPFWALPPKILSERARKLREEPYIFNIELSKGEIEVTGPRLDEPRAKDQVDLMKRWKHLVGDVIISMAAHDGPTVLLDDQAKQRLNNAADKHTYVTQEEAEDINEDASLWGFPLTCPAESRIRRAYNGLEIGSLPPGPSYVADHLKTMDLCENPEWQYLHGFTAWPGPRPMTLQPVFSMAKMSVHSDILCTPLEQYWNLEPWDPEWDKKPNNKIFWRGTTTGVWFDRTTWWRSSQRVRLFFYTKDPEGHSLVRFVERMDDGSEAIVERNMSANALTDRYLDFGFTGKAGQCTEDDGSCDAVKEIIEFLPAVGWPEANEYKYQLDVDGNAWSGRFHRLLTTNSAVLKSTIFPEWYSDWIEPWVHYIPIKIDYTDLFDIMAFFSGDMEGNNGHDDLAKQIADQGKRYAADHWRYEDMEAYFFRLCLEWARLMSPDREQMDYVP